ncbi:MAG: 2-hydroxyacid dehydrogenase [Bauldia sp.]|nr:2-hydroxyacid dehydrogenase [Bauldia sp.]
MVKVDILSAGGLPEKTKQSLAGHFTVHRLAGHAAPDSLGSALAAIRGLARGGHFDAPRALMEKLPKLEIVANFGVGYDGIDLKFAAERGIVVTNTPDVLTEEVADTALGLLLMTVRELSAAERHLRDGKWPKANYRLTPATMRDRTVGIAGLGRIGLAIARRLDAMQVPVVYHARHERPGVAYRHYPDLAAMAADVDTLVVVLPGNESTRHAIDMAVLKALGPTGVLVNIGRGIVVDEAALIAALTDGTILAAGLDVFADEPNVPAELIALPNAVLLPHVGSASIYTRDAMGQLVFDNLKSWFETGKPLTPVPETPWPRT